MNTRDLPFTDNLFDAGLGVEIEVFRIDLGGKKSDDFIFTYKEEYFRADVPYQFSVEVKEQISDEIELFGSCKIIVKLELKKRMGKEVGTLHFEGFV